VEGPGRRGEADGTPGGLAAAGACAEPHDFLGSVRAAWVADPEDNPVELGMRRNG
jgi:hypothetical protein